MEYGYGEGVGLWMWAGLQEMGVASPKGGVASQRGRGFPLRTTQGGKFKGQVHPIWPLPKMGLHDPAPL